MKVLYFGRLREQLKLSEELLDIPKDIHTVATLVSLLHTRGDIWSSTLKEDGTILVAINHQMGAWETPLADSDEVAFFPPVTGG